MGEEEEEEEELTTNKHRLLLLLLLLGLPRFHLKLCPGQKIAFRKCIHLLLQNRGAETDVQASEEGKKVFFDFFPFGKLTRLSPAEREGICLRAKRGRTGKRKREGGRMEG